ncbi:hypothetical protein [Pseudolabrys sp. FHR47]|uniref:hypothetical protein n=1 Tax=Pseudolabrys sp. FHR47 TaxID=2562284 RepID=UPI0010BEEE1C|nr:hypothetical protein [Pseudolabrys sp. FHR47]
MSILTKTVLAAGLALSLGAAAAHASDASEWGLATGQAYFVGMDGKAMKAPMKAPGADIMARAQEVPRGTIFFMHDGKLMMFFDRSTIGIMSR